MIQKLLFVLLLFISTLFADDYYEDQSAYRLGEGFKVGKLPIYIGGYFSMDYRYKEGDNRFRLDDLAFLSYGSKNNWSYMAEFEFKEFYTYEEIHGIYESSSDTSLHLERLYVDYNFNENYMLRGGKYNSPIGFWNLWPINVLRETTSSPISNYIIYPKFTTGALFTYTYFSNYELKVDLMLQENEDFDASYNNYETDEHYAAGVTYTVDDLDLKFNFGYFENLIENFPKEKLYYALVSLKYETDSYQILSEWGTQRTESEVTTEYAGYLQGVYHFTQEHAGIMRVESYKDNVNSKHDDIGIIAYTYRPLFPVAIKSEYQFHSLNNEDQFLFSISVLF